LSQRWPTGRVRSIRHLLPIFADSNPASRIRCRISSPTGRYV
jgi:hypothetical protein